MALAVAVVVVIFGLTLLAVHWFLGTAVLWQTIYSRWFVIALIIANSVSFSFVFVVMEISRRRSEKNAVAEDKELLPAAERFARDLKRDKPKL